MNSAQRPTEITFEFAHSPFFRAIHSNGAWGGITPRGELSVTFYSERLSLPRTIVHEVTPAGVVGDEITRDHTKSIRRECEVEVLMNMESAISLHSWLGSKVEEWRRDQQQTPLNNDQMEAS